ncbi:MAG: hypothetical protein SPF89_08445 [Sphaerochaetaceae bacterium]|nr:hypothetical protein [Spirochaetales bacterium]MDY5500118.1 hypothetical protein [Sphaerochaetaceae bacterium]
MAERKSYGKQIFASLVITVLVLGALVYAFGAYLIPKYQITQQQIYDIMVKLFPILIGLVMIQAGVMVAHRRDDEYADQVDKLPPNAYDEPLSRLPGDDPARLKSQNMVFSQPLAEDETKEEPAKSEEPIVTESEETAISPTVTIPAAAQSVEDSFTSILENELESAADMDYDLTLVLATSSDEASRAKANERIASLIDPSAFSFTLDDGTEAMIFPFFNQEETEEVMDKVVETLKGEQPQNELKLGYASRSGRVIGSDILIGEAKA